MLAMALAKTGSIRNWTTITDDLHLPATYASRVTRLLRYLHRNDTWPTVLTALNG